MKKTLIVVLLVAVGVVAYVVYFKPQTEHTRFGKDYDNVRVLYGSPIIHEYMEIDRDYSSKNCEIWHISEDLHNTLTKGFHASKTIYITETSLKDTVLEEKDIFRKRLNDTVFAYLVIGTYGNFKRHHYDAIYCGTIIIKPGESPFRTTGFSKNYPGFPDRDSLTLEQGDSILHSWGVNREK